MIARYSTLFILYCSWQIALETADAAKIKLESNLTIRTRERLNYNARERERRKTGTLKAGSIVEIPNRFVIRRQDGAIDPELSLNYWLSSTDGGATPGFYQKNRIEYYFPVRVVHAAEGSQCPPGEHEQDCFSGDNEILISLHLLARQKGQGPPQLSVIEDVSSQYDLAQYYRQLYNIPAPCPNFSPAPSIPTTLPELINDMTPIMASLQTAKYTSTAALVRSIQNTDRLVEHIQQLDSTLRTTCGRNINSTFLCSHLNTQLRAKGMTPPLRGEHLLALIAHESAGGNCLSNIDNTTKGQGLFQIHPSNTNIRPCSKDQWRRVREIADNDPNQLQDGPQCLNNPLVNLSESTGLLEEQMRTVKTTFAGELELDIVEVEQRFENNPEFLLRILFSSYNGGTAHIRRALADLKQHKRSEWMHLSNFETVAIPPADLTRWWTWFGKPKKDPFQWEDLKTFYFAKAMQAKSRHQGKCSSRAAGAVLEAAIINVGYVDGFFGTEGLTGVFPNSSIAETLHNRCPEN